jgi:chorismate mutase / prephenate dehydratase
VERIAVLGAPGTYTDLAAPKGYEKVYFSTIKEVFQNVEKGTTTYGIVPIENLLKGPVEETMTGLTTHDIDIVREIELPIVHCLIRKKGEKNTSITKIFSHPQALKQCAVYLKEHHPEAAKEESKSTRAALDHLELESETGAAAIGSAAAAHLLNLDIEKEGIGNQKVNRTLFMLIKNKKS